MFGNGIRLHCIVTYHSTIIVHYQVINSAEYPPSSTIFYCEDSSVFYILLENMLDIIITDLLFLLPHIN